jgi:hypothetical protein
MKMDPFLPINYKRIVEEAMKEPVDCNSWVAGWLGGWAASWVAGWLPQ